MRCEMNGTSTHKNCFPIRQGPHLIVRRYRILTFSISIDSLCASMNSAHLGFLSRIASSSSSTIAKTRINKSAGSLVKWVIGGDKSTVTNNMNTTTDTTTANAINAPILKAIPKKIILNENFLRFMLRASENLSENVLRKQKEANLDISGMVWSCSELVIFHCGEEARNTSN